MKRLILLSILITVSFLISCNKEEYTGKVTFYTNAQSVLNCGPFDVEIYIDGSLEGIIKEPFSPLEGLPDCNSEDGETLLIIEKPEGEYDFTARLTCSQTLQYIDNFKVTNDSCTLVYIDLTYSK